jgi:hypothetical protein
MAVSGVLLAWDAHVIARSTCTLRRWVVSKVTLPTVPFCTQLAAVNTMRGESSVPEHALVVFSPSE